MENEVIDDNKKNNEDNNNKSDLNVIQDSNLNPNEEIQMTPSKPQVKKNLRKNSIIPRRSSLIEKISLLDGIPGIKQYDSEIKEILQIIEKKYYNRTEQNNQKLFNFLMKTTKLKTELKSDFLQTNVSEEKLYDLIGKTISAQIYNKNDNIYIIEEKAEMIYILLRGKVGLYKIDVSYEKMSFEEYLLYLYNIKVKNEEIIKIKNQNEDYSINEFVDDYLLMNILDENKIYYKIRKLSDILGFPEMLFLLKLYKECNENNGSNILNLYNEYNYPLTKYNYNNVVNGEIKLPQYISDISKLLGKKEYFYLDQFIPTINLVKKMKYIRTNLLEDISYFGNFEILETKPLRLETAKCESSKALIISINKKQYSSILYKEQKEIREKELELYHSSYIFKELNKNFFANNIYSQFKIIELFVGNELFIEDTNLSNFYIIKEGTLELSLNNCSILDLKSKIQKLYNLIKKEVHLEIKLRESMIHSYKVVEKELNIKRKFLVFSSEKGLFGDYELYFNLPSLFSGVVSSQQVKMFIYPYQKFNHLYKEVSELKESLKFSAINKLEKIIERLASIYNSYFSKIENDLAIKQQEDYEDIAIKENENKKPILKNSQFNTGKNVSKRIKNNLNYTEYNNNIFKDLKYVVPENIIKKWKDNFHKSKNKNITSSIKKYNELSQMFKTSSVRIRPQKIFLPSIVSNELSLNKTNKSVNITEFNSTKNSSLLTFKSRNEPLYINIGENKIKFPERTERNCPLINRIRKEQKKEENKLKKKKNKDFINIIINDNTGKKIKNIYKVEDSNIKSIRQFLNENKDKITIK